MKKILLTQGKYALVDDEDFEWLNQWRWHLTDTGYARRNRIKSDRGENSCGIRMHRVVNNTPNGFFTDHINRNKLDNRKCNLRSVDKSQNAFNCGLSSNNKSGYKGVYFESFSKKWRAEIRIYGVRKTLGRFLYIVDAVIARKKAEEEFL